MSAAVWDAQAATLDDAWRAVWAEDDQQAGIDHCMSMLAPLTDHLATQSSPQVLDVGAGIGRLAIPMAALVPDGQVWALDVSTVMLGHLMDRSDQSPNVRPVLATGDALPTIVPAIHGAYSVVTLQHLPAAQQASYIDQVAERLRPGGMFRFQVVVDAETGPLSHPVTERVLTGWCTTAGLDVACEPDPRFPTWLWVTAVKP